MKYLKQFTIILGFCLLGEVLRYLLPYRDTMRAAVAVSDVAAVEKAFALGVLDTEEMKQTVLSW